MRKGTLNHGDRVEIYRNLHNNTFSVRRDGIVVRHIDNFDTLLLTNAKFAVQPAGRAKVLSERKKNVHAFIRGFVDKDGWKEDHPLKTYEVYYNPYASSSFQKVLRMHRTHWGTKAQGDNEPIKFSPRVLFSLGKVYVN
tara:strand:- start:1 stop:417 length:417 start_codon:yes stop_codon:yes gene_type:complete